MATVTEFFDMHLAPMRIAQVSLKVRDLDMVASWYKAVLGLIQVTGTAGRITLGTQGLQLLELVGDPGLDANDRRQAGLFHTAFLMPTRADLARWLTHAVATGVPLQGASDHIVSEAIYLADPEGNGIEVYVDRPVARWHDQSGAIRMSTDPLDAQGLLAAAEGTQWAGFPEGGMIGHIHLQVGDTAEADRFYRDVLGYGVTTRYPGASFYGSGGYHHQLAGNVWNSRRVGKRAEGMAGLDAVEIMVRDALTLATITNRAESAGMEIDADRGGVMLCDPWGTAITLKNEG
ncbi:VOC family protein [Sulfitobacter sp. M57]|jgi:catechol 2,3-dioxygenase|uniref:VOC family protein n=1 Tax=unclassified Sulfitobacter TaxID=196795 RepID=UPI0023E1066C|nr:MULTISPECIES: VOC family protein [unclassified Sulfitobacter]MDF3416339.1 VOC family protein [Sulfitobacter sp. KE5]MDF3423818.1 VOC family protein [Sulfitobacter sp. KE43]MDF3434885.1 VOC family protein [Sulfitobacter sp. KE42]MDF3460524.1 VOC family protein [Sulfitobacter sp. S74]MDF3464422.1 VOC family protein [Sulfitobacter sp. Ks18]